MTATATTQSYLASQVVSDGQIREWVDTFDRQGFLFLEKVLPPGWCAEMREDLDRALRDNPKWHRRRYKDRDR